MEESNRFLGLVRVGLFLFASFLLRRFHSFARRCIRFLSPGSSAFAPVQARRLAFARATRASHLACGFAARALGIRARSFVLIVWVWARALVFWVGIHSWVIITRRCLMSTPRYFSVSRARITALPSCFYASRPRSRREVWLSSVTMI